MNESLRIIYPTVGGGGVAIIVPAPEWIAENSIEDLVVRTVPAGTSYRIVSVQDIPSDRTFRNAWEYVE